MKTARARLGTQVSRRSEEQKKPSNIRTLTDGAGTGCPLAILGDLGDLGGSDGDALAGATLWPHLVQKRAAFLSAVPHDTHSSLSGGAAAAGGGFLSAGAEAATTLWPHLVQKSALGLSRVVHLAQSDMIAGVLSSGTWRARAATGPCQHGGRAKNGRQKRRARTRAAGLTIGGTIKEWPRAGESTKPSLAGSKNVFFFSPILPQVCSDVHWMDLMSIPS